MQHPTHSTSASVLLVQLSDSHLFAEADGRLLGMNTYESLQLVVDQAQAEQAQIDLVLATGDLSQDGTLASYLRFTEQSERLQAPVHWIPGNHDEIMVMEQACAGSTRLKNVVDLGQWRIILLDSAIPGAVPGHLAEAQLSLLEESLCSAPERHHLICLHHHPVSIGCAWMEPIGLRNRDAFFAVLDRYPQARAVLWGHVHQNFDQLRGDVRLLASPSTCVQFEPGSEEFQVGSQAPGYRWLRLFDDGQLETGISRVADIDFEIDYSVTGY